MRTVVIYETTDETCLYVADGDLTRFEGILVNSMESDETLANELAELDFGDAITTAQAREYIVDGALLVHCGFIY